MFSRLPLDLPSGVFPSGCRTEVFLSCRLLRHLSPLDHHRNNIVWRIQIMNGYWVLFSPSYFYRFWWPSVASALGFHKWAVTNDRHAQNSILKGCSHLTAAVSCWPSFSLPATSLPVSGTSFRLPPTAQLFSVATAQGVLWRWHQYITKVSIVVFFVPLTVSLSEGKLCDEVLMASCRVFLIFRSYFFVRVCSFHHFPSTIVEMLKLLLSCCVYVS